MAEKKFYAVRKGKKPGIYSTWDKCKKQVDGFSGAEYKGFGTLIEAETFLYNTEKQTKSIRINENEDNEIIVYVDGSYNIKTHEYGFGCVIIEEQKVIKEMYGKGADENYASMRNVAGEILGSICAMEFAKNNGYKQICIYFDYEGIEKWANGMWKANKPGTQEYQRKVKEYRQDLKIAFVKVLAHSGDFYNERADVLAKKAVGING